MFWLRGGELLGPRHQTNPLPARARGRRGPRAARSGVGRGAPRQCRFRVWHPNPLVGVRPRRFTQAPPPGCTCFGCVGVNCRGPATKRTPRQQEQGGVGAPAQRAAASGGGPRGIVFRGGRGCGQPLQNNCGRLRYSASALAEADASAFLSPLAAAATFFLSFAAAAAARRSAAASCRRAAASCLRCCLASDAS